MDCEKLSFGLINMVVDVEFDQGLFDPFFNVNSPDDLLRAERLLGTKK